MVVLQQQCDSAILIKLILNNNNRPNNNLLLLLLLIWFCKMGNAQTAAHWSRGPEASLRCPRHLCRITHWRHCYRGRCSGEPGSSHQSRQIWWTGLHAHLLPSCHRNRRYLESLAVQLVQEIGRRATLITGEPRESACLFQQLSIVLQWEMRSPSSTPLTQIRRRCSHTLLITMLSLWLCASERKKNNNNFF